MASCIALSWRNIQDSACACVTLYLYIIYTCHGFYCIMGSIASLFLYIKQAANEAKMGLGNSMYIAPSYRITNTVTMQYYFGNLKGCHDKHAYIYAYAYAVQRGRYYNGVYNKSTIYMNEIITLCRSCTCTTLLIIT